MLESILRRGGYPTDKLESGYLPLYDQLLGPLRARDIRLLELGVKDGASLRLWRDFFPNGLIAGIDLRPPVPLEDPRIRIFAGRQEDTSFLDDVADRVAPGGFDVVIDDCSHIGSLTESSFWHLFRRHLKPGGLYIIEDWGTGYWAHWPDGMTYRPPGRPRRADIVGQLPSRLQPWASAILRTRHLPSHDAGMVGFIKRLVDECGRPDHTRGEPSAFESVEVRTGLVVVRKGTAET